MTPGIGARVLESHAALHNGEPVTVVDKLELTHIAHTLADCERALKADPSYDIFRCTPRTWACHCGRYFEICESEADGLSWVLVDDRSMPLTWEGDQA